METKRLDPANSTEMAVAAGLLKQGGIVAIPTETVYGLAASAYDDRAIAAVFAAKGRPQDNPLIVHICNLSMLPLVAKDIPDTAYRLAEKFWPGPLTMVLHRTDAVCASVSAGLDTVAVRFPSDPVAQEIIRTSGLPLAAPSANRSGSPSPTTADHVLLDLDGKIDAVLMGGRCLVGVESTVVALFGEHPRLLRPGAVTAEQLREILPDLIIDRAVLDRPKEGEKVASPGMKYRHYAPRADLCLVEGDSAAYCRFVNKKNDGVAVCFDEDEKDLLVKTYVYGVEKDERTLAHGLFDVLRQLDADGVIAGYVHAPKKTGVGLAVYNRLIRACAYKVVKL